jgi:hypothetical protein
MPTLGGIIFVRNAIQYDYCLAEAVESLREICHEIVMLDVGSDDGTDALVMSLQDRKTKAYLFGRDVWDGLHGREKLATFQNMALSFLDTDYYFLLQADEVLHEDSFPFIRKAIETNKEGFYVTRLNLWKDCNHVLDVPQERKPCSTEIIRLAKTNHFSVGDGESIGCNNASTEFMEGIKIWHLGFVRKKEVMIDKIKNMQTGVFEIPYDPKLDGMKVFDWKAWFSEEDLKPITGHPKFITNWIKTRP